MNGHYDPVLATIALVLMVAGAFIGLKPSRLWLGTIIGLIGFAIFFGFAWQGGA